MESQINFFLAYNKNGLQVVLQTRIIFHCRYLGPIFSSLKEVPKKLKIFNLWSSGIAWAGDGDSGSSRMRKWFCFYLLPITTDLIFSRTYSGAWRHSSPGFRSWSSDLEWRTVGKFETSVKIFCYWSQLSNFWEKACFALIIHSPSVCYWLLNCKFW